MGSKIEHRGLLSERLGVELLSGLRGEERVEFVEVDDIPLLTHVVEVSHTDLSEVTRMVLIHVDSVVVLTSGKTSTTWMLSVLTDSTVTGRDVTSVLSGVVLVRVNTCCEGLYIVRLTSLVGMASLPVCTGRRRERAAD